MREELRATFRLALPLAIAQLSTYSMGVVDTACVGLFSADALAAVAIGNSLHWGFAALGMGVSLALDPLIAQAVGAREPETAWNWLRLGVRAAVWVAVPLVLLELLVASNLALIGIDAGLADLILDYCLFRAPALRHHLHAVPAPRVICLCFYIILLEPALQRAGWPAR